MRQQGYYKAKMYTVSAMKICLIMIIMYTALFNILPSSLYQNGCN